MGCIPNSHSNYTDKSYIRINKSFDDKSTNIFFCILVLSYYSFTNFTIIAYGEFGPVKKII